MYFGRFGSLLAEEQQLVEAQTFLQQNNQAVKKLLTKQDWLFSG